MKRTMLKITALGFFAAAMVVAPVTAPAAESTNAPAAAGQESPAKHKKSEHATVPFHGKLTAIDTNAMTFTVGERTFAITSETKITKDNLPATLADGVVGETVGGAYRKNADGKLSATSLHFGSKSDVAKPEGKKKKKATEAADSGTNSMAK
ncbi:MAG: hypothetical protein WCS42_03975 [Verrucomicrobiota bacterium]